MKQFIITILVLLFTFQTTSSQVIALAPDSTPQMSYDYYMLKQKQNKTAAWILLGGGVAVTVVGAAIFSNTLEKNPLGTLLVTDEGAKSSALPRPPAVGFLLPMTAICGRHSVLGLPSTYSAAGGEGMSLSNAGYSSSSQVSR